LRDGPAQVPKVSGDAQTPPIASPQIHGLRDLALSSFTVSTVEDHLHIGLVDERSPEIDVQVRVSARDDVEKLWHVLAPVSA